MDHLANKNDLLKVKGNKSFAIQQTGIKMKANISSCLDFKWPILYQI